MAEAVITLKISAREFDLIREELRERENDLKDMKDVLTHGERAKRRERQAEIAHLLAKLR